MSSSKYDYPLEQVDTITDLKDLVQKSARIYGDKTAFCFPEAEGKMRKVSYSEFEKEQTACSLGLAELLKIEVGKTDGKKVALIGLNSYQWAQAYLSVVNLNQVVVPLDWQLPAADLLTLLTRAGVNAVIYSSLAEEKLIEIKDELVKVGQYINLDSESDFATSSWNKVLERGLTLSETKGSEYKEYQGAKIFADTMCTMIFTSGTTSIPKGVMLSHKNLSQCAMGLGQLFPMTDETTMSVLPLFHSYESMLDLFCMLRSGGTIYYLPGGMKSYAANLQIAKPTLIFVVPLIVELSYKMIMGGLSAAERTDKKAVKEAVKKFFGGRLKTIVIGGAPANPVVSNALEEMGIAIIQGYGISEVSPVVSINRKKANKHAAVGFPIPNLQTKIDNPNEEGIGEILVHGPSVMLGYYKDTKETEKAFKDGWFCTGDYGYFDEDGFLYVTGRKKNVIIGKNAKNVYPEELEFLLNNTDGITESMVYGEMGKDGDIIVAALIVADEKKIAEILQVENGVIEQEEIKKYIDKKIKEINKNNVKYKAIKRWTPVAALARNATGKVKRNQDIDKSKGCDIMD